MVLFNKRCICTPLISEGKILFSFSFFLLNYQLGHCGHVMICSLFLPRLINIDSASSYILDSCTTFLLRLYDNLLLYENIMISLLNSYYPYINMLLYFSLCVLFNTMLLVGKYLKELNKR
jgi:hypothetical protein